MRISTSVKISCSTLLKGSLILFSPFELHLEQVLYPRGWRESKELILLLNTSSFIETCLVCSPKPEHPWEEVSPEGPHLPQGCASRHIPCADLFSSSGLCSALLTATVFLCSSKTGTSPAEKIQFFSPAANPIGIFNGSRGALVSCPESQEQAWGKTDKLASTAKERCAAIP